MMANDCSDGNLSFDANLLYAILKFPFKFIEFIVRNGTFGEDIEIKWATFQAGIGVGFRSKDEPVVRADHRSHPW